MTMRMTSNLPPQRRIQMVPFTLLPIAFLCGMFFGQVVLPSIVISNGSLSFTSNSKPNSSSSSSSANDTSSYVDRFVNYHHNIYNYTSSWCPKAECQGTALCYPCQRRWLIIITNGRSASTTLTEMVGRLPSVRMTGENNNLVSAFGTLLRTLEMNQLWKSGSVAAWHHNPIPDESWSCAAQTVFSTANPPLLDKNGQLRSIGGGDDHKDDKDIYDERTVILGFKTIRLFDDRDNSPRGPTRDYVQNKVDLINRMFPCGRFIVNFRSDMDALTSSWRRVFGQDNATLLLEHHVASLHMFHEMMGTERSFLMDSTQWTQHIHEFNKLLDWLGFSKECYFERPLEYNTAGRVMTAANAYVELSSYCRYLY